MKIESQITNIPNAHRLTDDQHPPVASSDRREISLDILRGLAVMLMLITHAIAFFHVGDNAVINLIGTFGGTASFGLFLFLSGASSYFSFLKYDSDLDVHRIAARKKKLIYRSIGLLTGYYIVAVVATIPLYSFPPSTTWVENIARTVFLVDIPPFAEFILPFVFFSLCLIPFRKLFRFLAQNPLLLICVGLALYFVGVLCSGIAVGEPLSSIKGLVFGEGELHRFPLFQYSIVFLFGIAWGRFLMFTTQIKKRLRAALLLSIITGALVFVGTISNDYAQFSWLEPLRRWPPALTFIFIGFLVTYAGLFFVQLFNNLRILGPIQMIIRYWGANAFDMFIIHILVLYTYKYITGDRHYAEPLTVLTLYVVLLVVSTILALVKSAIIDNLKAESNKPDGFGWIFSEKMLVSLIWVALMFICGMSLYQQRVSAASLTGEKIQFKKVLFREQEWPFWWDHSYNYFQQITITNPTTSTPIQRNTWYAFQFNHMDLVNAGHSSASGNDVRIVFYDTQEEYFIELPFVFDNINASGQLKFKLQEIIPAGGSTDQYFLYYGNPTAQPYPASVERPTIVTTEGIVLSDVYSHRLRGQTNRRWYLKEGVSLQLKTLLYTVDLDPSVNPESLVSYYIVGTELRGQMDSLGGGKYQASIKITDLPPGTYQIQATAREPEDKLRLIQSGYNTFYVSYPLYVVWSMDWEGWDVEDWKLAGLDEMANRYNIPLTHFFNPRIYVCLPKARADQLTLFVQNRAKNYRDEIALHLHMFYDLVSAAGVTPRSTPYASWLYADGGGVPAYAYTVEEMKKILLWSQRMFQDNGLPTPVSFRAGGWLAAENTLQSLEESGFLIDSSGRTAFSQRGFAVPWNLSPTQTPYQPNREDINSSASPTFRLWEFPNNGADSYWFVADDLIQRFDLNYPNKGGVMDHAQVLTYLSHPLFFGIDKPKMEKVFSYIANYLYEKDIGPVIYTTMENAYYSWDRY